MRTLIFLALILITSSFAIDVNQATFINDYNEFSEVQSTINIFNTDTQINFIKKNGKVKKITRPELGYSISYIYSGESNKGELHFLFSKHNNKKDKCYIIYLLKGNDIGHAEDYACSKVEGKIASIQVKGFESFSLSLSTESIEDLFSSLDEFESNIEQKSFKFEYTLDSQEYLERLTKSYEERGFKYEPYISNGFISYSEEITVEASRQKVLISSMFYNNSSISSARMHTSVELNSKSSLVFKRISDSGEVEFLFAPSAKELSSLQPESELHSLSVVDKNLVNATSLSDVIDLYSYNDRKICFWGNERKYSCAKYKTSKGFLNQYLYGNFVYIKVKTDESVIVKLINNEDEIKLEERSIRLTRP